MSTDDSRRELSQPLPENELAEMGVMLQIPQNVLALTLAGTQAAVERAELYDIEDRQSVWLISPTATTPTLSNVQVRSQAGWLTYYNKPTGIETVGMDTLWAATEEELEAKIERRRQYEEAKLAIMSEHPLGEGGLLLANEFGGIDPGNEPATARHLVLRAIIAKKINPVADRKFDIDEVVEADLLHPLLGKVVGKDFMEFLSHVSTIMDAVNLLPESSRGQVAPHMLSEAVTRAGGLINKNAEIIRMSANVLQNGELASIVLSHIEKLLSGSDHRSTWQYRFGKLATQATQLPENTDGTAKYLPAAGINETLN